MRPNEYVDYLCAGGEGQGNVDPFVEKMLSAVKLGRFLPCQRSTINIPIIHCETIGNVLQQLSAR